MSELNAKQLDKKPLTFIFPHLHHNYEWDISNCSSLWIYFIANNIAEPLIRIGNRSQYEPGIATSWSFTEDKKQITFLLSDKYRYHNGELVTYEDIYKSIERVLLAKKTSHSDLSNALCIKENKCQGLSLNKNVLTISLEQPINGILFNIATPEYGVVHKTFYNHKIKPHDALKNLSGPYQVLSFDPKIMKLQVQTNHPLIDVHSPKDVVIKEIVDTNEAIKYLINHKESVFIASDYNSGLRVIDLNLPQFISAPSLTEFLVPNILSKHLDTVEKRKTIFSIFNHVKNQLEVNSKIASLTNQIFTHNNLARLDEDLVGQIYKTKPKTLKHKVKLNMLLFDWMKESPIPLELKKLLTVYNIDLNIVDVDIPTGLSKINSNDYDLTYIYSGVSAIDPIVELIYLFKHPITRSFYTKNEEALKLLNIAKSIIDRNSYVKIIRQIHMSLLSEYRVLPLFHTKMVYVSGGNFELRDMNHFDGGLDIWRWKQKSKK